MATREFDELQSEAPPAKRARFDNGSRPSEGIMNNHGLAATGTPPNDMAAEIDTELGSPDALKDSTAVPGLIPGLGLLGQSSVVNQKSIEPEGNQKISHLQSASPINTSPDQPIEAGIDSETIQQGNLDAQQISSPSDTGSPTILAALEALLGAPTPPAATIDSSMGLPEDPTPTTGDATEPTEEHKEVIKLEDTAMEYEPNGGESTLQPIAASSQSIFNVEEAIQPVDMIEATADNVDTKDAKEPAEELEEAINLEDTAMEYEQNGGDSAVQPIAASSQSIFNAEEAIRPAEMIDATTGNVDTEQAEFEVDSSPYESSSDDSSDDSSSSDDDEGADAYKLLSPEEQARILMEGDGGSDDEGGGNKGAKGAGAQLRTKNEVPEEVVPKPNVTITAEMKITELGYVEHVVESIALIKAKISGEYKVLETGSVLCLEDRSVIGVVADTLGRVQQPLYSVRFTNSEEITKAGLEIGTRIFYSEQHSTYVFTQTLKAFKGSDASNLHDEEVGDEEVEFSDDEKEMEHKRRLKQKKLEKRGGGGGSRGQRNGDSSGRGGHHTQQQQTPYDASVGLSYDDEEDGPYKPLTRPAGFAQTVGRTEAPQEGAYSGRNDSQPREPYGRGRGRGDRGDRGRGRGRGGGGDRGRPSDRGQGRGGFQDRRDDAFAQRPYENPNQSQGYSQPPQGSPMGQNFAPNNYNYNQGPPQQQYSPQQPFAPLFPPAPFYPPQPYQQPYGQAPPVWPHPAPTGTYINPAFFGNQQQPGGQHLWPPPPQMTQSAESQKAFNEAQERLNILRNLGVGRGGG